MLNKEIKVQAPGRINIIGEHTDYIGGYVLPAAIDKKTTFSLCLNGTESRIRLTAKNTGITFHFDTKNVHPIPHGNWKNYLMGVVSELQKLDANIQGFDAEFEGDVPIGSGMSSSAALECSLAFGLNQLFDLNLKDWQLIKACQKAEHHFVGTKCGIMDQFSSIMGQENKAMLLDCKSLHFKYVPLELGNYELLLFDTNIAHSLASSEYNNRRKTCESGLEKIKKHHPKVSHFRELSLPLLEQSKEFLSPSEKIRLQHGLTENQRVQEAVTALKNNDLKTLGKLMYASHESLKTDYEVSCPELDFLVDLSKNEADILGSRMMGGGFGGCTLNLVNKTATPRIKAHFAKAYMGKFGKETTAYSVNIGDGAKLCGE